MIKKIQIIFIVFTFYLTSISFSEEENYKIIKLINNHVITNYDLEMRLQLFSFLNNVSINAKNIDQYASEMLKLMSDEKLQLDHINKYQIEINSGEVNKYITRAILKPEQTISDFEIELNINNVNFEILKESIRIQLGWNELSGRLFFRTVEITDIDLTDIMKKNVSLSEDQARNIIIQNQIGLRATKLLRDLRVEANIENR